MLCDVCNKNIATIHLTEIVNEKVVEMHICQSCAKAKAHELNEQFNISDFVGGLADIGISKKEEPTVKCPSCGFSYGDFKKNGRLGCGRCYVTFREQLLPLLKKIHSSTRHKGKTPLHVDKKTSLENKLKDLRRHLERAIQLEEYEEAAQLRDEIKNLSKAKNV